MHINDFFIGLEFSTVTGQKWRCTDKGMRSICAIEIKDGVDPAWFIGPPYAVEERVFDEIDIGRCYTELGNLVAERGGELVDDLPGFPYPHSKPLLRGGLNSRKAGYSNMRLLRFDRVAPDGSIWHPYEAVQAENGWVILVYERLKHTFSSFPESEFVAMPAYQRKRRQAH